MWKRKVLKQGDLCRRCLTPCNLVNRSEPLSPKQMKLAYSYTSWLKCPKCGNQYLLDSSKLCTQEEKEAFNAMIRDEKKDTNSQQSLF